MIEVFPAKKGDCFLIHTENGVILIDSGFASTYRTELKPVLVELGKQGTRIIRFIITHIDEDHIGGAIAFLEENGNAMNPQIIPIDQIWHNSYRHLNAERVAGPICENARKLLLGLTSGDEEIIEKPISAKQGSTLASLIVEHGYNWNTDFSGLAVQSESGGYIVVDEKTTINVLTPNQEALAILEKYWRKELYKLGFREKITNDDVFDDAFEFLLAKGKTIPGSDLEKQISSSFDVKRLIEREYDEDDSPTNGSSIAMIINVDGKRLLFLGDSHPTPVCESLEKHRNDDKNPIYFDFIKVSHHGAIANNSRRLFSMTDAGIYCISSNGVQYGHPSAATLAHIIGRKEKSFPTIYFNYENQGYHLLNNEPLKATYLYDIKLADKKENRLINPTT